MTHTATVDAATTRAKGGSFARYKGSKEDAELFWAGNLVLTLGMTKQIARFRGDVGERANAMSKECHPCAILLPLDAIQHAGMVWRKAQIDWIP
ncbi:hypothetical protein ASE94_00170 [Devosia sp. Leaf64]|nr:hypothetical protein ASE94_00170 [Devosia sp. Leaf64]